MIQFFKTPRFVDKLYPGLIWRKESSDEIFLTFDDGPHPEITNWVLDELEKFNAKATFFCLGENLKSQTQTAERMVKNHLIANHSQNHLKGTRTDNDSYFSGIRECETEILKIQKHSRGLFRPPYGKITNAQVKQISPTYQIVMWSHLSWDFLEKLNLKKSFRILKNAKPGSIIVFHDNEKSFGNLKKLLPPLLTHWSSKNLKFTTL